MVLQVRGLGTLVPEDIRWIPATTQGRVERILLRPGTTVAYSLRDFRDKVRGRKTMLVPWLQDFSLGRRYTLADVQDQIQAARLEHVKGFMLWNASGVYTVKALSTRPF